MTKILVIDDDDFMRMVMVKTLRGAHYDTEESADGEDAFRKLSNRSYDMVITDAVMIPQENIYISQYVKEKIPGMPLLVVSSTSYGKDRSDAVNQSKNYADEKLQKPFKKIDFLETVARLSCSCAASV